MSEIIIDGLRLVLTCGACPEQYDVFDGTGKQVGYLRLRHGRFRADVPDCGGETVYEAFPKGDGIFETDERDNHLTAAVTAIKKWKKNQINKKIAFKEIIMDNNSELPKIGQILRFGSYDWEVTSVEPVDCDYDPDYTYRVNLIIRDKTGKAINFATGIPNHCIG